MNTTPSVKGFTPRELSRWMTAAAALLLASSAAAQQVYWNDPGKLEAGREGALELVFADTQPAQLVTLPRIAGLQVLAPPSQASRVSFVNARRSSTFTLTYPILAERQGTLDVPTFETLTSNGPLTVAGVQLHVGAPLASQSHEASRHQAVQLHLLPSTKQPYAGQVFDVDLLAGLRRGQRGEVVGAPSWSPQDLIAEPWSQGRRTTVDGTAGVRFGTRALAPSPGPVVVGPATQEVALETDRHRLDDAFASRFFGDVLSDSFFDSFFSGRRTRVSVPTNTVTLDVRPLPEPSPAGFSGAVGQFKLQSKLVPEAANTGEPVTWTLTLEGTGNWPGGVELPARSVPVHMRAFTPKQEKQFAANSRFTGAVSEDLILIPTQPGEFSLDPVRFVYFDPEAGRYETVVAEVPPLVASGSAIGASTASGSPTGDDEVASTAPATAAAPNSTNEQIAATHARLPHDPISGPGSGSVPFSPAALATLIALPFLALAVYWLGLAAHRARCTDPFFSRRTALANLAASVDQAAKATSNSARQEALLRWQQAAAVVLEIGAAAPTVAQLRRVARKQAESGAWLDLWVESERVLYGKDSTLPAGWCERATALYRRSRYPRPNPFRMFLPRNLLPATATGLLLISLAAPAAASPTGSHGSGDLSAAADGLREQLRSDPTDWVARYNLALAEAQQGNAGQALAQTLAAFVQHPSHPSVRWNLQAFAEQLPNTDRRLRQLATGESLAAVARLASPPVWQRLLVLGTTLLCLAIGLLLHRRYRGAATLPRGLVPSLCVAGTLAAALALSSLWQYGPLTTPGAAVVSTATMLRSIPTDAAPATDQKPVAVGAIVVEEGQFLGWSNVRFPEGERGWLRRTALVPLYTAAAA